jgi:hypothetical protein
MNDLNKDILISILCMLGVFSFISGLYYVFHPDFRLLSPDEQPNCCCPNLTANS